MRPGNPHLLLLSLAVLSLTSCHKEVHLFGLEIDPAAGPPTVSTTSATGLIALSEEPPQKDESEGYLIAGNRSTPLYTLREPYQVSEGGEAWAFTITGITHSLSVIVYGEQGAIVAQRYLDPPLEGLSAAAVIVPIPGSTIIGSLRIADGRPAAETAETADGEVEAPGDTPGSQTPRLVAVSTAPPAGAPAQGVTVVGDHPLIGGDTRVLAWGGIDGDSRIWSLHPYPDLWDRRAPVEIVYRYEPVGEEPPLGENLPVGDPQPPAPTARITIGGMPVNLNLRPGDNRVILYPQVFPAVTTDIAIRSTAHDLSILRVGPLGEASEAEGVALPPLSADLGTILHYPPEMWRAADFEIFRWTLFPEIIILDIRDYELQSRFFKRLAFYVEKETFAGRVLSDEELAGRHGYNAHNYNGEGLAAFFNAAADLEVQLTAEETMLREILEREGIIFRGASGFEAGEGGILSVSQESVGTPGLRQLLLTHEAYHGVYYSSPEYVRQIGLLWDSLNSDERRFWTLLLDGMQYEVTDEYLVRNEFHAYLLQQPVEDVQWYFEVRSLARLSTWKPHESSWLNRFLNENRGTFERQAVAANAILADLTGLSGGEVFCLEPLSDLSPTP